MNTEFLRIVGVTRTPSGEIVVANGGTHELRVFSPSGKFLRTLTRRGQGPGELQNSVTMTRNGDTLFVFEQAPGSAILHTFTVANGFRHRTPLRASNAAGGLTPLGRLASGKILVSAGGFRPVRPAAGVVSRDTARLGILTVNDSGEVLWLGQFPNNTWFGYRSTSLPSGIGFARYTLGPSLVKATSGDRAWIGDSETGLVTILDADGKSLGTVTISNPPKEFSGRSLDQAKRDALSSADDQDQRDRFNALYAHAAKLRKAPFFSRFVPSLDGGIGVEMFELLRATPRRILVVDVSGAAVGSMVIPPHTTIHEIGPDYIIGVETNEEGVETVVQYALQRG